MSSWLCNLFHDMRFAVRGLLRQPGFTSAVIILLAIAIGANVAMFSAFHQTLIRPLPYAEPENLVLGRATFKSNINPDMSAYDFFDYRERNEVFESVGAIITGATNVTITGGDEPEQVSSVVVSWDLFPTLGISAVKGRHFTRAEGELGGPNVVMVSGGYWLRRFGGSPDVIGSTILVDGTAQTIVGVMPPDFRFLHDADMQVMKRGLLLVAAGIALGLVGSFWASRLLQQMLFDTAPTDVATYIAASSFFALVGLVACFLPALKALKVDPVNALAAE